MQPAPGGAVDRVARAGGAVVEVVVVEVLAVLREHVVREPLRHLHLRGGVQVQLLDPHVAVEAAVQAQGPADVRVSDPELEPPHHEAEQHRRVEVEHPVVVEAALVQPGVLDHERAVPEPGRDVVHRPGPEGHEQDPEVLAAALARSPGRQGLGVLRPGGEREEQQRQGECDEVLHGSRLTRKQAAIVPPHARTAPRPHARGVPRFEVSKGRDDAGRTGDRGGGLPRRGAGLVRALGRAALGGHARGRRALARAGRRDRPPARGGDRRRAEAPRRGWRGDRDRAGLRARGPGWDGHSPAPALVGPARSG